MEDVLKTGALKFCPLRYIRHNLTRADGLQLDFIPLEAVVRPVFAFHDPDSKPAYQDEGTSRTSIGNARMWAMTMDMWLKCRSQYHQTTKEMEQFFYEPNREIVMNVENDQPEIGYEERVLPFVIERGNIERIVNQMDVNKGYGREDELADVDEEDYNVYLDDENYDDSDDEDDDRDVLDYGSDDLEDDGNDS